ncbi:MAG: protein kinase [Acidobacteriota bacterium]
MRYETGTVLGRGGMGEVYKVWDPLLERHVALKVLRSYSEEAAGRLLREARAQARLDHPHICRVYEVGANPENPYIAMQCIEGLPLDEVAPRMSLKQRVRAMAQVAAAVHEAHRTGLIHRDLKPGNILVEETRESGRDATFHPYVVDFGLVHQVDGATRWTVDGAVLGTPPFMAPEQAEGDSALVDRRSDVYGLGATLYQVLTGQPVFEGGQTDLLLKTLHQEPTALRRHRSNLPRDLEVITLKCLEKNPGRRYPSARALAEELHCFLDGEPIAAQAPTLAYHLAKKFRKHRNVAAVIALAAGALVALGSYTLYARWQSLQEAQAAQRFTAEVKDLEWLMRASHMSPAHDIRAERDRVRQRVAELEVEAQTTAAAIRGPALHAIGRGHLALGRIDAARPPLDQAWKSGYRPPEAAFALGLVYGRQYERAVRIARGIGHRVARETALAQAAEELRDPALEFLAASRGSAVTVPAYLEGLIAFYGDDSPTAAAAAAAALEEAPWLFEAAILSGDVKATAGDGLRMSGQPEEAAAAFDQAEGDYRRAMEIAPSASDIHLRLCDLGGKRMEMEVYGRGGDVEAVQSRALADCRAGIAVEPDRALLETGIATLWTIRAEQLAVRGEDRSAASARAEHHARRAVELDPSGPRGWQRLAGVFNDRALHRSQIGEDPLPDLDAALEATRTGIGLADDPTLLLNHQGNILNRRALVEMGSGADPTASLDQAIASLEDALARDPDYGYALNNLGRSHTFRARHESSRGLDARDSLRAAVDAYARALALNPENAYARNNLGIALMDLGQAAMGRGEDPSESFRQAEEAFASSLEVHPNYASAYNNRGQASMYQARWEVSHGRDPELQLDRANEALQNTVRLNERAFQPHVNMGRVEQVRARYALLTGADPSPALATARRRYGAALERNPRYAAGLAELANIWWLEADARRRLAQGSGEEALAKAIERATEALAIDGESVTARRTLAQVALHRARPMGADPERRAHLLAEAERRLEEALAIRPADAETSLVYAELRQLQGSLEDQASVRWADGRRTLDEALAVHRNHPALLAARGELKLALARVTDRATLAAEAEKDLQEAYRLNPLLAVRDPASGKAPPASVVASHR